MGTRLSVLSAAALLALAAPAHAVYEGTCTPDGVVCAYFSPTDMPIHAVSGYLLGAQKSIRILTYNMDVADYGGILAEKLAQGVRVEFLVDYKIALTSSPVYKAMAPHPLLYRLRVPVLRGGNPQMHDKVIIVDDAVVLLGSANFTYSGLVANYENVLAIRDANVIARFSAEMDELRAFAAAACELFATPATACGQGGETFDRAFDAYAGTGKMPAASLTKKAGCKKLSQGAGLLSARNQPAFGADCLSDPRWGALMQRAAANERFVDGTATASIPATQRKLDAQRGRFRVYFSPEDEPEQILLWELQAALKKPQESFVYVSTNFITNFALTRMLVQLKQAGVRMKLFFDRGRAEDGNFQQMMPQLAPLGFTTGETGVSQNLITIFNNDLTGPYASNHNKVALVGVAGRVRVLTGSANWSEGAMNRNDENLVVIEDPAVAAIYAREILSQLFVYRYYQQPNSAGWQDDLNYLAARVPCLRATLGLDAECVLPGNVKWAPPRSSAALVSVGGQPFDAAKESMWMWVGGLDGRPEGGFLPLFTHWVFGGRWMSSLPTSLGGTAAFKLIRWPTGLKPPRNPADVPAGSWEFGGMGNRQVTVQPMAVHVIKDKYTWGRP